MVERKEPKTNLIPGFNDFHDGFVPYTKWTEKTVKEILSKLEENNPQKSSAKPFVLDSSPLPKSL